MKNLIAFSMLIMSSTVAFGADLAPQAIEPAAPIDVAYSWTGFYAGANVGYSFGASHDADARETGAPVLFGVFQPLAIYKGFAKTPFGSVSPHGVSGGLQAGYNQQFGSFVVGIEGDIQGAGIADTGSATRSPIEFFPELRATIRSRSRTSWYGTVRPRIGFAFDNILVYATGGVAFGGVKDSFTYSDTENYFASASKTDTRVGYTVGGGVEYGITHNWTVKLEYLYTDLGDKTLSSPETREGFSTPYTVSSKIRTDFHTVRLGVNYKF